MSEAKLTPKERNHWAFCWWQAMEFAGAATLPWWRHQRTMDDGINFWSESGYERASMWLDGAPCEALP